jgi:serine/threonine protein kinase
MTPEAPETSDAAAALAQVPVDCVDESTLVRFFAGDLPMDRLNAVEAHLDRCQDCARLIEAAAPLLAGASGPGYPFRLPPGAEPGQLVAGRYRIDGLIGQGASGYVLRARDELAGVPVAVKLLRAERAAQPALMQLFTRELRVARALNHPHVCRVYDLQVSGEDRFLVMELGQGSLRDELRSGATAERSLAERLSDAQAIAAGLAAIHDAGVIHRDVKPENVLRLPDGRLVLSDFGLATLAPLGSATRYVGTPLYMAPEVAAGEPATRASDLYALGIVLHELFFGRRPEWHAVGGRRVRKDPPRMRGTRERAIARLTGDCLAELPERRPADARAVGRRLAAIREGRGTALMTGPTCNRRVILAAVSATFLLGGGVFSLVRKGTRNRRRARPDGLTPLPRKLVLDQGWRASSSNDGLMVVNRWPGPGFELVGPEPETRTLLSASGKDATLSPDGKLVAFVTEPFPDARTREELWALGVESRQLRRVALMGRGSYPSWSPDTRLLYFFDPQERTVMALSTEGGRQEPRSLFDRAPSRYFSVSPDGRGIAFGESGRVVLLDAQEHSEWLHWAVPERRGLHTSWSPDGRMVAFGGLGDDPLGVWVWGLTFNRAVRISAEPSGRPAWTPDGHHLTFDTNDRSGAAVWRVSSDDIRRSLPTGLTPDAFFNFASGLKPLG